MKVSKEKNIWYLARTVKSRWVNNDTKKIQQRKLENFHLQYESKNITMNKNMMVVNLIIHN